MTQPAGRGDNARGRGLDELIAALRADAEDRTELEHELARWLADTIPPDELGRITSFLSEEELRRRDARYTELLNTACTLYERGDFISARNAAEHACSLDPLRWEAHRLLAHILERCGEANAARLHEAMAFHLGADDAGEG